MAQYLRPDSDDFNNNMQDESAGTINIYTSIDESTASDSDYITNATSFNADYKCTLSNPGDTPGSGTHTLRFRYRWVNSQMGDNFALNVTLEDSGFGPVYQSNNNIATSWTTVTYSLNSTEIGNIDNYNNLTIQFAAMTEDFNPPEDLVVEISWAEFEVPDAATSGHPWFYGARE